jgi:hypothetical protein
VPIIVKKATAVTPERKAARQAALPDYRKEYVWEKAGDGYFIQFPNGFYASLHPKDGLWEAQLKTEEHFFGTRKTLEEAFRTLDRITYVKLPHLWTRMRCHEVLKEFAGDLSTLGDEDEKTCIDTSGLVFDCPR